VSSKSGKSGKSGKRSRRSKQTDVMGYILAFAGDHGVRVAIRQQVLYTSEDWATHWQWWVMTSPANWAPLLTGTLDVTPDRRQVTIAQVDHQPIIKPRTGGADYA
jgi:hypothetical protein